MNIKKIKIIVFDTAIATLEHLKKASYNSNWEVIFKLAYDRNEFISLVKSFTPNVVVSKCNHDNFSGIEILRFIRGQKLDIHFIAIVDEKIDEDTLDCLTYGISGYILRNKLIELPNILAHLELKKDTADEKNLNRYVPINHVIEVIDKVDENYMGLEYLEHLALKMDDVLQVDQLFISSFDEKLTTGKAEVNCKDGRIASSEAEEFQLSNTPAIELIKYSECAYSLNLQECFPNDDYYKKHGYKSYIGKLLYSSIKKRPIGALYGLYRGEIEDIKHVKNIINAAAIRAQQELERALIVSEMEELKENLRATQITSKSGSWLWDIESDTVTCSRSLMDIYELEETTFMSVDDYRQAVRVVDETEITEIINNAVKKQLSYKYDREYCAPSGKQKCLINWGMPKTNERGKLKSYFGLTMDVSDLRSKEKKIIKQNEELSARNSQIEDTNNKLKFNEQKFRIVFERAPFPMAIIEPKKLTFEDCNNRFTEVFKFSLADVMGKSVASINLNKIALAKLNIDSYGNDELNFVSKLFNNEGQIIYGNVKVSVVHVDGQKKFILMVNDLTDLELKKRELEKNEKKFRKVFNSFLDVYFETNMHGIIEVVTPSVENVLGYKAELLIGVKFDKLYEQTHKQYQLTEHLHKQDISNRFVVILVAKNGTNVSMSVNIEYRKNDDGDINGYVGVARNVTKELKNSLRIDLSNNINQLLVLGDNIENSRKKIIRLIADFLGARYAEYWIYKNEQGDLQRICSHSVSRNSLKSKGNTNLVVRNSQSNYFKGLAGKRNVNLKTRFSAVEKKELEELFKINVNNVLGISIQASDSKYGIILFYNTNMSTLSVEDRKLFLNIGGQIGQYMARVETQKSLLESLKEKDFLFKEVHHRVKNNLQLIISTLYLRLYTIQDKSFKNKIEDIISAVKSIAIIHEQLMQSKHVNMIDIAAYIESLTAEIPASIGVNLNGIKIKTFLCEKVVKMDFAVNFGLLINELMVNSIKHAFVDHGNGEISVQLKNIENSRYELIYKDNGKGIDDKYLKLESTDSLGLNLIDSFSSQLNAEVQIDNRTGTEYRFQFIMD